MMTTFQSLILGIVEGLTEFLPISSTFHLIVSAKVLGIASSEFVKLFEVIIQSGAIMALLFMYAKTLWRDKQLLTHVIFSFIPTAVIGFALHKIIKDVFFESGWLMLTVFAGVGVLFLYLERWIKQGHEINQTVKSLTTKQAILIGLAQACSIIPGVSRAGSVIVAMMIMGYRRDEAARYTFLLSLPTIFAASALDLVQGRELLSAQSNQWFLLSVGFIAAFFTAYWVVKWLIKYLETHTLEIFGWYRVIIAAALILFKVLP